MTRKRQTSRTYVREFQLPPLPPKGRRPEKITWTIYVCRDWRFFVMRSPI